MVLNAIAPPNPLFSLDLWLWLFPLANGLLTVLSSFCAAQPTCKYRYISLVMPRILP